MHCVRIRKAGSIIKHVCHAAHSLLSLPPSGRRYWILKAWTSRLKTNFFPLLIQFLNYLSLSHPIHRSASKYSNSELYLIQLFYYFTLILFWNTWMFVLSHCTILFFHTHYIYCSIYRYYMSVSFM